MQVNSNQTCAPSLSSVCLCVVPSRPSSDVWQCKPMSKKQREAFVKNSSIYNIKVKDNSAWLLTPFLMLVLNPTHVLAQTYNYSGATVDGGAAGGVFIGAGSSRTVTNGNFTNFYTKGGAGSGGGAGLGGVFFVDQNATLNLNNVQISGNVAKGGTGGSLPQIALADLGVNLVNLSVDITSMTAPGATPTLVYDVATSTYKITQMEMAGANPLIATGANVSFGAAATSGVISSVSGTTVTLAAPVDVAASAVKSLTGLADGTKTITVGVNNFGYSDIAPGMVVYGATVPAGTVVTGVTVDSTTNKVTSVTVSNPIANNANVAFDVIGVSSFDVTRFTMLAPNQIKPTSQMAGMQVGMDVTGTGIPAGTKITNIAPNGVITLSQNTTGTPTAFKASLNAATSGSNTVTLASPRSDLVVGMTVSGTGIPTGTTITGVSGSTLTLSNAVTSATVAAVADGTMLLSTTPVLASNSANRTVTLSSVAGIKVNSLLTGNGIPANAVVSSIDQATKTVTYRIDASAANLTTGGAMNSRAYPGSVGSSGGGGSNGSMYNAILHDGEGSPGTNGYNAGAGTNAPGGNGGNGGNGSRGLPYNLDAMTAVTSGILGVLKDTMEMAAEALPDPIPKTGVVATKIGAITMGWFEVAVATADLIKWQVDLALGLVAHGGDGGSGGSGGDGATFFGGGAGGKGGNGGTGATLNTDGGAGGDGGSGGAGGFGAGGGAGGKAGTGGENGQSVNGATGDGGEAGFGGGGGSNGAGKGGGGGSGFGGALFVRSGGALTVTGNALFENNAVLAGSSTNGGSAGEAAGTDLFMMKGSTVTLAPGAGKTITFRGTIADDSAASMGGQWASGEGADIQITGGGLVQFEGANTYTGKTMIGGGTLQAADGTGIHTDSQIFFNGTGTIGAGIADANAGVLLTSGDFVRRVGDLPHQVLWAGSGGFAAEEAGLTLNFGAIGPDARQTLVWDSNGFVPAGKTLVFGSASGAGAVTLLNDVNLDGKTGRIAVYDNPDAPNDFAVLKGAFFNGSMIFNDAGYAGTTYMTGQSSLANLTVQNGVVDTKFGEETGRLFDATVGGNLNVSGGTVNLRGAETINTLNVGAQGNVNAFGQLTAGDINNSGALALGGGTADAPNVVRDITNSGTMGIGSATTARNILNNAPVDVNGNLTGGVMIVTGDVSTSGTVRNEGTFALAANLTSGGNVTNNGVLSVLGNIQGDSSEAAATRTITTTGFDGSSGSFVNLGGANAQVANTLIIDQSGDSTYQGKFTGAGSLLKQSVGVLTLTGASTFTGGLTINGGSIDTTGGGTLADTLAVNVGAAGAYTVGTVDIIGSLTNSGLTTVAANLTVAGNTDNKLGATLNINSGVTADLKGNLANPGTLNNSGTLKVGGLTTNTSPHTLNMTSGSATLLNALNNTGNVVAGGSSFMVTNGVTNGVGGAMSLDTGSNSFGSLNNAGAINVAAATSLSTGSLSGGTTGSITLAGSGTALNVNQTANGTYSGAISGPGVVNKTGGATLTLNGAANSFAPSTLNINAGAVAVDGAGILASALQVTVAGGANLNLISGDQSINNLTGSGTLSLSTNNLTLANGGNFLGNVTGSGAVKVKSGAFTVATGGTMGTTGVMNVGDGSGASTLNAAGTLNAGSLNVNNGGNLYLGTSGGAGGTVNTDTLVVNNGGKLTGVGTIHGVNGKVNSTVIGARGTLAPGNSPGMLSVGDLSLDTGSTTNMQVAGLGLPGATNGYDQVVVTGALALKPGSTLNLQKVGFEFGMGQKAQIFSFAPGGVSGNFGTVNSDFAKSVIFNVPTGTVIGLGDYTATTFTNAISTTPNQMAIVKAMMVNNAGGVNQYYGGRLMEHVTAALAPSSTTTVKQAFDKWSPEAYMSMMDHMKFSMLNNMPELGGYANLAEGKYTAFGSLKNLGQSTDKTAGYVQSKFVDNNVNVGLAYQSSIGQFTFAYGHSDGSLKSDYMKGSAMGEKVTMGASLPFALGGSLRATARMMFGTYAMSGTRETNEGKASFGSLRGNTFVYGPGLEYAKDFGNVKVNATTEVLGMNQSMPGFTEGGVNPLEAMSVRDQSSANVMVKGDVKLGYMFNQDSLAYVKAGVTHQVDNNMRTLTANARSDAPNFNFSVQNPGLGATQVNLGLGANVYVNKKALFSVDMMRGTGGLSNIDLSFKYMFD